MDIFDELGAGAATNSHRIDHPVKAGSSSAMGIVRDRWRITSREIKTAVFAPNRRQLDKYGDFVFNLLTAALLALIATVWTSEWTFATGFNAACLVVATVVLFVLGALGLKGE